MPLPVDRPKRPSPHLFPYLFAGIQALQQRPDLFERHSIEGAVLVEVPEQAQRPGRGLVVARLFLKGGERLGDRHVARFPAPHGLLHQLTDGRDRLGQRFAAAGLAEQAPDAVRRQPVAQPIGQRFFFLFQLNTTSMVIARAARNFWHL